MKYFNTINTIEEVKSLFKKLAFENHPDKGGDTAIMQEINAEYKFVIAKLAKNSGLSDEETQQAFDLSEQYQNAINAIAGLNGIIIELVGAWIWVTGKTFENRYVLKEAGFLYASKKQAWYFRSEDKKSNRGSKYSLEQIKTKYGSKAIKSDSRQRLSA